MKTLLAIAGALCFPVFFASYGWLLWMASDKMPLGLWAGMVGVHVIVFLAFGLLVDKRRE